MVRGNCRGKVVRKLKFYRIISFSFEWKLFNLFINYH